MRRCYVYVIGPENGPYKIGISSDIKGRIAELQVGSPVKLSLMWKELFEDRWDARRVEASLHQSLDEFRMHGEWFNMSVEDIVLAFRNVKRNVPKLVKPPSDIMKLVTKYAAAEFAQELRTGNSLTSAKF